MCLKWIPVEGINESFRFGSKLFNNLVPRKIKRQWLKKVTSNVVTLTNLPVDLVLIHVL